MKAWLITWEWLGDHAKVEDPIAGILNPRWQAEKVRDVVELLYANSCYSLSERLSCAKNRSSNPYPAQFGSVDGVPFQGAITCGHNPWLYARKVTNLRVESGPEVEGTLAWTEEAPSAVARIRAHIAESDRSSA